MLREEGEREGGRAADLAGQSPRDLRDLKLREVRQVVAQRLDDVEVAHAGRHSAQASLEVVEDLADLPGIEPHADIQGQGIGPHALRIGEPGLEDEGRDGLLVEIPKEVLGRPGIASGQGQGPKFFADPSDPLRLRPTLTHLLLPSRGHGIGRPPGPASALDR